jgi:Uma2 family endonuclease
MPTTTTRAQEHQERWGEIVRDPSLQDLPYKVETNRRGQIVLSPQKNRHSVQQKAVQNLLDEHAPEGMSPPEFAIATPEGVKVPDVAWMSNERWEQMQETGDPTTLAPEICVEVLSSSNTAEEIREKRALYREAGAKEVWVVDEDGQVRFFGAEEMDRSEIAEEFPAQV